VPYEYVVMDKEEGRSDEHAARHPLRRVPVLETDEGLLFESAALCFHLADQHPEAELIPAPGTFERGEVYQWSFFAMTEMEPAMLRAYVDRRGDSPEAAARADARLEKTGRVLAERLDGLRFIVGDRFTVADVIVGGVLENAREYKLLADDARLLAYLEGLDARPAKQRAYAPD
jgi:glutathione S-transferase